MGLAEKRMAATCQKELENWKKKVNAVAGYELAFDVPSWEALVKEGFLDSYPATIDYNFFAPLEGALKSICADDLGKEALKGKIKKVRLTSERSWSSLEVKVDGDTLHLDADPSYERTDGSVADYTQRIQSTLEAAL